MPCHQYTGPTATSSTPNLTSVRSNLRTSHATAPSERQSRLAPLHSAVGIGCFRTSKYYNRELWMYDLASSTSRTSVTTVRWVTGLEMTDIRYNRPNSDFKGENMRLYADEDYYNDKWASSLSLQVSSFARTQSCNWYPIPLYKIYVLDQSRIEATWEPTSSTVPPKVPTALMAACTSSALAETCLLARSTLLSGQRLRAAQDVNKARINTRRCSPP